LTNLVQAFSQVSFSESLPLSDPHSHHPMPGLLNPARPFLIDGVKTPRFGVAELLGRYETVPFNPTTIETILFATLPSHILRMIRRTVALEVNVMRLQGLPPGDTVEARFRQFTDDLRRQERALRFWLEYPVLARQVGNRIRQWATTSLELIGRLCADWEELRATFSPDRDPGLSSRWESRQLPISAKFLSIFADSTVVHRPFRGHERMRPGRA